MITDAAGQVVARYDYLPFGEPWPGSASPPETRRFAGKEQDPETGLDYFGARYYASGTAGFTTVDPVMNIEAALRDPQRWNRYAYVSNNPLRLVDPDGRDQIDPNLARMLELLKAPRTTAGAVRGPLIQNALDATVGTLLGELFGYPSRAVRGGLSMEEYALLQDVSIYEDGALMLGVDEDNAPGIDAVDLTHAKGVSLKTASNANNVVRNAEDALKSVQKAGFYDVQVYTRATTVAAKSLNHRRIRRLLNERVTKIVVFTADGPIDYAAIVP